MKLPTEFIRLPFAFDAARLQEEVDAIAESEWLPHPQGFRGNSALLLVSANGEPRNDSLKGYMAETPVLAQCEYLRQVLATFGPGLGRTRLMRIDEHEEVTPHVDVHYYWREHLRIHVPIVTDPSVQFVCGDKALHMAAGECWVFDTWRTHHVRNPSSRRRIHLVADTRGTPSLWRILRTAAAAAAPLSPMSVPHRPGEAALLVTEGASAPVVMSPPELAGHIDALLEEMRAAPECSAAAVEAFGAQLDGLRRQWHTLWFRHAATSEGWPHYRALLERCAARARRLPPDWRVGNGSSVAELLQQWIVKAALNPELARDPRFQAPFSARRLRSAPPFPAPVFIVAAPRSGSTLLFETLARSPDLWTVGGESHQLIEGVEIDGVRPLAPEARGWHSNRLDAGDAAAPVVQALHRRFAQALRDREGLPWTADVGAAVRLLEKTPKNALRIGFLASAFPDARFIYLVREPKANASSILEAWRSGEFVTYEKLPDWKGGRWSLLLIPGWREMEGCELAEVAVAQYRAAHEAILADLAALPRERWCAVAYEALLADPDAQLERLAAELGIAFDRPAPAVLPRSAVTLGRPVADKWRRNADALAPHLEALAEVAARVAAFTGIDADAHAAPPAALVPPLQSVLATAAGASAPRAAQPAAAAAAGTARLPVAAVDPAASAVPLDPRVAQQARALASVHTRSFAQVLATAGIALAVSTYQAGKLVIVRADGEKVNTNFREMRKPMGIAYDGSRLAIGTASEVQTFHNVPAAAARLEPVGRVDAAWLPRTIHFTGNIDIHEMAYDGAGTLWSVNTRFCCLCTTDEATSFVPRWKPPFLSGLAPEDRCHLNGLGLRDGRVRYVTMLGRTDTPGGWRADKASGGLLMDLDGERVLCDGLSMPHSPRWYRERLWVLESGTGGLCRIDPDSGAKETIVELPGFTRGLDFYGPLAFVGLSQVRESAVFARLPLTERLSERTCGVWVVNIEQGEVVGFLRFEQAVQEIFALTVLAGARFPELVLPGDAAVADAFVLPDEALRQVPAERLATGL